jgi:hypothetical protein
MDRELPIRVTVINPPLGVTFAMQRGKDELLPPSKVSSKSLVFDLSIRVSERKAGGAPNMLGPYAQGKPDDRFLYLNSGTLAGQENSCWTRRAKIKTGGINWQLIEATFATPGAFLEVQIDGQAKDGGPCCATVPLAKTWEVRPTRPSTRR